MIWRRRGSHAIMGLASVVAFHRHAQAAASESDYCFCLCPVCVRVVLCFVCVRSGNFVLEGAIDPHVHCSMQMWKKILQDESLKRHDASRSKAQGQIRKATNAVNGMSRVLFTVLSMWPVHVFWNELYIYIYTYIYILYIYIYMAILGYLPLLVFVP